MTLELLKFLVINPTKTKDTNLCTNPSFESGTTGWTTGGTNTIATSVTEQRRGVYSCKCTYTDNDLLASYAITLTDTDHVASIDVYIPSDYEGTELTLTWTGFTSATIVAGKPDMTIRDKWQRVHCHINPDAGDLAGTLTLSETGTNGDATEFIYIDGVLIEARASETTYFDGDTDEYCYWSGQQNASTSVRRADSRNGGTLVDLEDYMHISSFIGFGMNPIAIAKTATAGGRSLYQRTNKLDREMIIIGEIIGNSYDDLQTNRKALLDLFKPDLVNGEQEVTIRYMATTSAGKQASEIVDVRCRMKSDGLIGHWSKPTQEPITLMFEAYDDLMRDGNGAAVLGYQTTVANVGNIIQQGTDGVWSAVGTGLSSKVYCFAIHPVTGDLYVGGEFINAGGDPDADYLAKWNGTAWSSVFAGMTDIVRTLLFDAAGNLYIGGEFLNVGSGAGDKIVKWDGSNISSLGTGLNGDCYTLTFDPNGDLIAGGAFTLAGGVANTVKIAKWDGSNWTALGTGATGGDVLTAIYARDDNLYVGGTFTLMGGVANTVKIAKWNGTAWSALSTGLNGTVRKIALTSTSIRNLLIGGEFTNAGGDASADYLAEWNGYKFSHVTDTLSGGHVSEIYTDNDKVYIGGSFTTAGSLVLPDRAAIYQSGNLTPLDINVNDALAFFNAFIRHPATGVLYVGGDWSGTDAYSSTVTVPSVSGTSTYPKVTIIGPGKIWQIKNHTNNKAIYFNGLTVNTGETITIDFDNNSYTSNFRGNIMSYIIEGISTLDFKLENGTNNISSYLFGSTTAASSITMTWKVRYWSLDEAKR